MAKLFAKHRLALFSRCSTTRCCHFIICTLLMVLATLLVSTTIILAAAAAAALPATSSSPITETELIAVDLGHENMKIAAWRVQEEDLYIKAGGTGTVTTTTTAMSGSISMVLNDQTNRKSPPCVAFRYFKAPAGSAVNEGDVQGANAGFHSDGKNGTGGTLLYPPGYQLERTFAEQAQALAPRFPTQVICSPAQLLGITLWNSTSPTDATAVAAATTPNTIDAVSEVVTPHQLTATYSFYVKPLNDLLQGRSGGNAAAEDSGSRPPQQPRNHTRQALGVFVPFFPTSTTDAVDEGAFFSAEELTAMLLGYARQMAEKADAVDNALSDVDERQLMDLLNRSGVATTSGRADLLRGHAVPQYAALTIPVHATVAQRQALIDAASLAGLRVVRLVHSTTGAAVQLAYMKAEQVFLPDKPQYVMVYDMGSQQAEVAVYSFTAVPASVARKVKVRGSIELKALVGSRTLGGAAFDECIAAQWDELYFNHSLLAGVGRASTEVARRAAAKQRGSLLRAAHKAKETLSVNQEAHITLDGVHADPELFRRAAQTRQQGTVSVSPDGLLSLRYTRAEFERTCASLFDAAVALRDDAIAATGGLVASVAALDRFEVVGGGTRIPRLLQRLSEGYRGEQNLVDRTLNSDEAAVLGTTLLSVSTAPQGLQLRGRTAALPQFRVREWLTNAVYVSVTPTFSSDAGNADDGGDDAQVKREKSAEVGVSTASAAVAKEGEEAAAYLRLLFPAHQVVVPATRSVRVRVSSRKGEAHSIPDHRNDGEAPAAVVQHDNITVTLYSGARADKAYHTRAATTARAAAAASPHVNVSADSADLVVAVPAAAACASCYVRAYVVEDIKAAEETLREQVLRQHPVGSRVLLDSAEVVAEVVATVSGIPHCNMAYLRAVYHVTRASATTTTTTTMTATPTAAAEAEADKAAKSPQRAGADELNERAEAPANATEAEEAEENPNGDKTSAETVDVADVAAVDDAAAANLPTTSTLRQVKMMALPLRSTASVRPIPTTDKGRGSTVIPTSLQSYNMDRAELRASHERLRRLQAMDAARLRRSTLRNDIQSVIVWVKDQPAWDAPENNNDDQDDEKRNKREAAADKQQDRVKKTPDNAVHELDGTAWRGTVREIGEWLDDYGETASVAALEERLAAIRAVKMALRAAQNR